MSRHWTHYVLLHPHYAAIDDTSHYLTSGPCDEHPWEHLTEVVRESEYSRTLCFRAVHPCGASFRWHIPVYATSLTDRQPEKVVTIFSYLHLIPASHRSSVFSLALSILDDQRLRTEAEITDPPPASPTSRTSSPPATSSSPPPPRPQSRKETQADCESVCAPTRHHHRQGDRLMRPTTNEPLRYEDAAEQTTVTGWKCVRCGFFYGDNEHAARWCCHTDSQCPGCGGRRIEKHYTCCESCREKKRADQWAAIPQVDDCEVSSESPVVIYWDDRYFFDIGELFDYCADVGVKPSDLRLVLCQPNNPPPFDLLNYLGDYLPDECDTAPGTREDHKAVERVVDDFVKAHSPLSWIPDKRRPSDAVLAAWDAEYAKEIGK